MKINAAALLRDYNIKLVERGKNSSPGWTNTKCPFCDDPSDHLGWSLQEGRFHCWKCGAHRADETIAALLRISEHEAYMIMLKYQVRPSTYARAALDPYAQGRENKQVIIPGGALTTVGSNYLIERGYDPDKLTATWGLTQTDPFGQYKFRIVCPIWHDDRIVSFQGRDYTNKQKLRWKSCEKKDEARDHKHCLGGIQLATGSSVAVVEGFSDAWRLGPGAVCTFGTSYIDEQIKLLIKYKRLFVVLDSKAKDPNAHRQAERLADMVSGFCEVVMVELDEGDPGSMSQDDADACMREWRIK